MNGSYVSSNQNQGPKAIGFKSSKKEQNKDGEQNEEIENN